MTLNGLDKNSCLDENLLRRVSLRTDGANIHDVNGVIGAYRSSCSYYDTGKNHADENAKRLLFWSKAILMEFADTGDIKSAKKNWKLNPERSEGEQNK